MVIGILLITIGIILLFIFCSLKLSAKADTEMRSEHYENKNIFSDNTN